MQSLIVTFVTKSGCEQALVDTIIDLQRETALEAGVIRYELLQGAPGTRTFLLYERYADEEALKTHRASPYLQAALVKLGPLLAQPPTVVECGHMAGLQPLRVEVDGRQVTVHTIPLGPAKLVLAQTERGILACGAIDPAALQRFGLPTARVKPTRGPSIANFDDLLAGEVREANDGAITLGIKVGMNGHTALQLL